MLWWFLLHWGPLFALVFLASFARDYITSPLRILRQDRLSLMPTMLAIELSQLPPIAAEYSVNSIREFAVMGFVSRGAVQLTAKSGRETGWTTIWVNESTCDIAQVVNVLTSHRKIHHFVQFMTEFTDGSLIATSNPKIRTVLPGKPEATVIHIPSLANVQELYRLHRLHVSRDQGDRRPTLEKATDAISRLQHSHTELCTRLTNAGYYKLDPLNHQYVPTLKAAILVSYAALWPFRQLIRRSRNQKVRAQLARLGYTLPSTAALPLPPLPPK